MIWDGFDWAELVDADIRARRAEHVTRLAAEHARIAQERQSVLDRAIVAERERRVLASRERAPMPFRRRA